MEIIRRNTDYALRALAAMSNGSSGKVFFVRDIADDQKIPQPYLHKIFQRLAQAEIVRSHRGPSGGFSLAKRPKDITVKEVIEAVQGPVAINRCFLGDEACPNIKECLLKYRLVELQADLLDYLDGVTIAKLSYEKSKSPRGFKRRREPVPWQKEKLS